MSTFLNAPKAAAMMNVSLRHFWRLAVLAGIKPFMIKGKAFWLTADIERAAQQRQKGLNSEA